MRGGGRYLYAPSMIFMLGLLAMLFDKSLSKWVNKAARIYIVIATFIGILRYPLREGFVDSSNWKRWKDEAVLYKAHSIDTMAIYPQW